MGRLASDQNNNTVVWTKSESELPTVSILMAAYNEESVLDKKIVSLLSQDYPVEKIQIFIGSDNSTDRTNEILRSYEGEGFSVTYFDSRQGKPSIINRLAQQATAQQPGSKDNIFLLTDASVMLEKNVIFELVKHFKNDRIGMVDAHMTYVGLQSDGISKSENSYLSSEVKLKANESKVWKQMIGPFGGCFAMRVDLYTEVPDNFLVDDFYLAMHVLAEGYQVINEMKAICSEPVSHLSSEEFRRKKRISTGNFQNLFHYSHLLNPFTTLGFSFWSHKVIRWLGPFLMALILLSSLWLAVSVGGWWNWVLMIQLIWFVVVPVIDMIMTGIGFNVYLFRSIAYFNKMNWALLLGFLSYLGGVKSNIWQPTARS